MKTYLGAYTTPEGNRNVGIYYGTEGLNLFYKETFCPLYETRLMSFEIKGKTYAERKSAARDKVIEALNFIWTSADMSYSELATIFNIFESIGNRYGLTRELRSEGII